MNPTKTARRNFLKTAGQTLIAAPALSAFAPFAQAQQPAKPAVPAAAHKPAVKPFKPTLSLSIRDMGAVGDGKTKDTDAIRLTIERVANLGGGEVVIPAGEFLTAAVVLRSNVTLHLEEGAILQGSPDMADYPLSTIHWEGRWIKGYIGFISAMDAENIAITGKGKIIASAAIKGRVERPSGRRLPALMEFTNCKNVLVQDVYTEQSQMWSIHPTFCTNITFKNVGIKSGADGIDADSCHHVVIDGCKFDTTDDCISLKSGRGLEAASQIGVNPRIVCEDVLITNCSFVDHYFACIGIGSEISGGIRNVRIEKCKFDGARSHAVFIKSRVGRGAFVEDISVSDCDVSGMQQGFLSISNTNTGKADEFDVPGEAGISVFRNFRFSNIRVTDVPHLVEATQMHPLKPLDGLTLTNITGTCKKGMTIANAKNVHLSGIKVTGFEGPLLATKNVTGTGLTGAVPYEPAAASPAGSPGLYGGSGAGAKVPDLVPEPASPYVLR